MMKARELIQQANQFPNCNIGLKLLDENHSARGIRATKFLTGTQPWTRASSSFLVPENVHFVQIFAFCSISGSVWFDDLFINELPPPDWKIQESEHYVFHSLPEAPISRLHQKRNEEFYGLFSRLLGVEMTEKIDYFRYIDESQKSLITGRKGNAHVEYPSTVHTLWPVDDHEVVHLLTRHWGETDSPLFGEGIAVALGGIWQGKPVHSYARELHSKGALPPLAGLVSHQGFRGQDDLVTYAAAGSFVKWLIDSYGMESFRQVYVQSTDVSVRLASIYGKGLTELEKAWLAKLSD
jgi:hypothetical protein